MGQSVGRQLRRKRAVIGGRQHVYRVARPTCVGRVRRIIRILYVSSGDKSFGRVSPARVFDAEIIMPIIKYSV